MHNYCSVLSKDYIHRGLMLYNSLIKHDKDFRLFFVCLNREVKSLLDMMGLEKAVILTIEQVEKEDPELVAVKAARSNKEYAWTSKGSIFLYLFRNYPELDYLLWLDSDIVFYSDPEPIFNQLKDCSILLTRERFNEYLVDFNNIYGIFNTGLMGFKKNDDAVKCIEMFRKKCIEWCYDWVEPGRWSDQMYVNYWPWIYNNVKVVEDIGINATPWNIQGLTVSQHENDIYLNDNKLIFFHYSGFRYNNYNEYDLCGYINLNQAVRNTLYVPYINNYQLMIDTVNKYIPHFYDGLNSKDYKYKNYYCVGNDFISKSHTNHFCTITTNGYFLKCLALYDSISRHTGNNFHLWICAVDKAAYELLCKLKLENATVIHVEQIENEALLIAKNNRNKNEYCWTIKASFIKYLLRQNKSIESILYVDSDTYMFSKPFSLFDSLINNDVLLTSHNFTQGFYHLNDQKGKYNAGIVGFKNSKPAMNLLCWWEKRCIEWCYNQVIPNKFADQKYLESIERKHRRAAKIESLGVNTAMWNLENRKVGKIGDNIYINNDILVLFHFSSFYIINEHEFDLWKSEYLKPDNIVKEEIFIPYVKAIKAAIELVKSHETDLTLYMSDEYGSDRLYNHFILS